MRADGPTITQKPPVPGTKTNTSSARNKDAVGVTNGMDKNNTKCHRFREPPCHVMERRVVDEQLQGVYVGEAPTRDERQKGLAAVHSSYSTTSRQYPVPSISFSRDEW
jgi:hypothetical protein